MFSKLHRRAKGEEGFTLIELLVVILILGILAAIAIPSFLSQRTKAQDAAAKEGVLSARTAIETYATDNDGNFTPTPSVNDLQAIEATLSNVNLSAPTSTADTYSLTATSASGTTFTVARSGTGRITRSCNAPGSGGCRATLDSSGNRW